jgi:hypothetical protein
MEIFKARFRGISWTTTRAGATRIVMVPSLGRRPSLSLAIRAGESILVSHRGHIAMSPKTFAPGVASVTVVPQL